MNKHFFQFIFFIFLQFIIIITHLFLIDFLPHPYSYFNLVLAFLILYITIVINPQALWSLLPFIWFVELFSSLPFGINALALLIVLSVFNLILITIFSNRSLPTLILSSVFLVLFYRLLLWGILKTVCFFVLIDTITINSEWVISVAWEIFFTTLITASVYFILSFFLKRLRPEYITALQKEYESKRYFR